AWPAIERTSVRLTTLAVLLAGLALGVALVVWAGAGAVFGAALATGVSGILAITIFNVLPIAVCGIAWRALVEPAPRRGALLMIFARFLRSSVSELVPIGGELLAIRAMTLHGIGTGAAGAATVVDLTLEFLSQLAFTAMGLALLVLDGRDDGLALWSVLGLGVAALAALAFLLVQRGGLFHWLERLPHRLAAHAPWARLPELVGLHAEVQAIYRRPRALLGGFLWHCLGWVVGAGEAWLALWLLNAPLGLGEVLILESLAFALRSAAFAVPAGVGVQEGGYAALGALFGLGPEIGLALSLLKRAREALLAVPALLAWKIIEFRAWRSRSLAVAASPQPAD
ncbi:MAG TPA: lysylphosphatidylglycerol synthase domain-containing protein, partial [Stellaceae bacterium]|nr:lysylphosphatidylglycerol synthase domain-containing protein [Stellaceae bacterium]